MTQPSDLGHAAEPVYAELLKRFDAGTLRPSERLPPQMKLCREFRVSRSTIQKVINQLTAEGRIVSKRGGGTFVSGQRTLSRANNTIAVMCILSQTDFAALQGMALEADHLLCPYIQDEHDWQSDQERAFLEQVHAARHKALLALCSPKPPLNDALLERIAAAGTRVIHLSPYHLGPLKHDYLVADYAKVGYLAGASLMARRPDRVFMAGYGKDGPYVQLMKNGFREALAPFGLLYDDEEHWLEASDFWESKTGPTAKRFENVLRKGERIAVFARGFEVIETIRHKVRQAFQPDTNGGRPIDVPRPGQAGPFGMARDKQPDLRMLAYTHAPVDPARQGDVDLFLVHTQALMERALASVLQERKEPLRELVAPKFVAGSRRAN
jgi:DNA-binding LacI/PurR family transcriptional regulator